MSSSELPPLGLDVEEDLHYENFKLAYEVREHQLRDALRRLAEVEAAANHHLFALAAIRDARPLIGGEFHLLASAQKRIAREAIDWKPAPTEAP